MYSFLGRELQNLAQVEVENFKKPKATEKNRIRKEIIKCLKRKFYQQILSHPQRTDN